MFKILFQLGIFPIMALLLVVSLAISIDANAQDCQDGQLNGEELRIDCGGPDCWECIPLLYDITCSDQENGSYDLSIALANYWNVDSLLAQGIYYQWGDGDINNDQPCFLPGECNVFLTITDANYVEIRMWKYDTDGDTLGYSLFDIFLSCLKAPDDTSEIQCPVGTEFAYTVDTLTNGNAYMLKIGFEGGTPPYFVYDEDRSLFYTTEYMDDVYYLGAVPDSTSLNLLIYDVNNCIADKVGEDPGTPISALGGIERIEEFTVFPTVHQNEVQLGFDLLDAGEVHIEAFTLDGRSLGTVVDRQYKGQGYHQMTVNTSDFANGVYLFALSTGNDRKVVRAVKGN